MIQELCSNWSLILPRGETARIYWDRDVDLCYIKQPDAAVHAKGPGGLLKRELLPGERTQASNPQTIDRSVSRMSGAMGKKSLLNPEWAA
jgi:hypothetical protein